MTNDNSFSQALCNIMKIELITETLSNLEIAKRQLNRSIKLFLNEKDFVSSITLAGAAEELLGKILEKDGKTNALKKAIESNLSINGIDENSLEAKKRNVEKGIANLLNEYKNRMKHYSEEDSYFSVDYFAVDIINRAMENYYHVIYEEKSEMLQFKEEILLNKSYE